MHRKPRSRSPRPALLLVAVLVAALGALAWTAASGPAPANHGDPPTPTGSSPATSAAAPVAKAPAAPAASTTAPPVRLGIPAIGLDSTLESLVLAADGSLRAPVEWDRPGWYANGARPGDRGPAIIVGHLDSAVEGPAVFYRLRDLRPGDEVVITQSDGGVLRYVVDTTLTFPKSEFPTATVYGPTPLAELRLITCGGDFDSGTRSYLDNLIVTAHLA